MRQKPKDYDSLHKLFTNWWRSLHRLDQNGKQVFVGSHRTPLAPDRKTLAELRRIDIAEAQGQDAVDVDFALSIPTFRLLVGSIKGLEPGNHIIKSWLRDDAFNLAPFAIAAATLARIREDTGAKACGATAIMLGGNEPLFAEARFKRLMRTRDDWPDLLVQARRLAAILGKAAPIGDLGASLLLWNADPSIRTRWAFNYYRGELEKDAETEPQPSATTSAA